MPSDRYRPSLWDGSEPEYSPCTTKTKKWFYWKPPARFRKAGYAIKALRLPGEAGDGRDRERAAKARELTREMLRWYAGSDRTTIQPGSWGWLIGRYRSDADSPFQDLKANSREDYLFSLSRWEQSIGDVLLIDTDLSEIRRWQRAMRENGRSVSYIRRMFTMLRIVAGYGKALRLPGADDAKAILAEIRVKSPRPRSASPSPQQIAAIVAAADAAGDTAFATGLLLQWWLTLRAVDVRGQYLRMTQDEIAAAKDSGAITRGSFRWADGLTWDMIDRDVTSLRKTPSKTEDALPEVLDYDLTLVPELRTRLRAIAPHQRMGPVITDRQGMPYDRYRWSALFRLYRKAANVPDSVQMRDTRAGAINDAKRAGATPIMMQHQANHASLETTNRYVRERSESIAKVLRLRRQDH